MFRLQLALIIALLAVTALCRAGSSDTESKKITGPIRILSSADFGFQTLTSEPYLTGNLSVDQATSFIRNQIPLSDADRPTIIHLLQWSDDNHTGVNFQQWYVWK